MSNIAFVFLVGLDEKTAQLEAESDQFGDLIITEHYDTYNNLTLKTLAAFDWMQMISYAGFLLLTWLALAPRSRVQLNKTLRFFILVSLKTGEEEVASK